MCQFSINKAIFLEHHVEIQQTYERVEPDFAGSKQISAATTKIVCMCVAMPLDCLGQACRNKTVVTNKTRTEACAREL